MINISITSPGEWKEWTYQALLHEVEVVARALIESGLQVVKGSFEEQTLIACLEFYQNVCSSQNTNTLRTWY